MYKEKARLERANKVEKRQLELTLDSANGNEMELYICENCGKFLVAPRAVKPVKKKKK